MTDEQNRQFDQNDLIPRLSRKTTLEDVAEVTNGQLTFNGRDEFERVLSQIQNRTYQRLEGVYPHKDFLTTTQLIELLRRDATVGDVLDIIGNRRVIDKTAAETTISMIHQQTAKRHRLEQQEKDGHLVQY